MWRLCRKPSDGLLFISETDAPLTPFFWPDADATAPITEERLRELAEVPDDASVKTTSLTAFFAPLPKMRIGTTTRKKAEVARFVSLVETLKSILKKPQVWRIGETKVAVYVVGAVEGGWAGVQTKVVET